MFSLNVLQLRPADDIYLPPPRPSSARGRAHRPPPSFPSSSLVIPSIHLDPPPSHLSPNNAPDGSEGFLFYFDPSCAKARKLEAEVDTLTRSRKAPLVTRHLPQATHVLVNPTSSFGERFFQDQGSSLGPPFLLQLRWIKDSIFSGRWQHETDYLYHPLVSNSVLATLFPEEEPSTSMVLASTSILLDDANEVEDIPVEAVQEVEPAMEPLEEEEPRAVAGVEGEAEAAAGVESEGGDESGDEDEDVSNPLPSDSPFIASEEPSDDKFATFLHAMGPNVSPWPRDAEGRDSFDLYVRGYPNQTADWWRTRFREKISLFIELLKALKSQPSHEIEELEVDPSSAQSMDTGVIDGPEVETLEEAANAELPLEDDDENEELEEPVEVPTEMGSVEPVTEEDEPTLSIEILEEMFLEMRNGLELKKSLPVEDFQIATFEASTDVQLSPEVDVANGEIEQHVDRSNQTETVQLVDFEEDIAPTLMFGIQQETKEQQQKSHHSPFSLNSSSSSASTPSSSTHSIYSTPDSSPSPSSSRLSSRSPGPPSPKRRRLASREASTPPPPIVDASESNSLPLPLPPLPSPLPPAPSPFARSPRSRRSLSSSLSPPPDLPPPKPFEPPSFLELGVPSSFLPTSFAPACFFCGFEEAAVDKFIQQTPICLSCFKWLDEKIDERGDTVLEVEALEDGGRLAWALCMWKVNGLRERRGRVRAEDGGTMVVEWRGGEL